MIFSWNHSIGILSHKTYQLVDPGNKNYEPLHRNVKPLNNNVEPTINNIKLPTTTIVPSTTSEMAAVSFAPLPSPTRPAPTRPKQNHIKNPIDPARLRLVVKTKLRDDKLRQDRDLRVILSHVQLLETTERELERYKEQEKFWREHRLATARAMEQARLDEWRQKIVCREQVRIVGECGFGEDFELVEKMEGGMLEQEWMYSAW